MSSTFVDIEEDDFEATTSSQTEGLLSGEEENKKEGWAKYEGFFDVDTSDVVQNLKTVIIPKPGLTLHTLDLYGPFWIVTTLIFSISLAADVRYDFDAISIASGYLLPYLVLSPLALYGSLYWKNVQIQKGIPELISLYGYSLLPFIPLCLLLIIPLPYALHAFLIFAGTLWSSATLGLLLWNSVPAPFKHFFIAIHFVLMFLFIIFFTRTPFPSPTDTTVIVPSSPAVVIKNITRSA